MVGISFLGFVPDKFSLIGTIFVPIKLNLSGTILSPEAEYFYAGAGDFVPGGLEVGCSAAEHGADGDGLWAVLFAAAAADAEGGAGGFVPEDGGAEVVGAAAFSGFGVDFVPAAEGAGDIDAVRAGHAVGAAGAGDFEGFADFFLHLVEHSLFGGAECADGGLGGDAAVFFHHFEGVHAGEDDRDAALAVEPAQAPLGRRPAVRAVRQYLFRALRKEVDQAAAAEGFHDDDGDALRLCGLKTASARLRMLVHVVVLDLTEVPVIGIQNTAEFVRRSVEGEADLTNLAGSLLLLDPVLDAEGTDPFPGAEIGDHVHEVVVDVICSEPREFFLKGALHLVPRFHQVVRELCGNVDAVTQTGIPHENGAECGLVSRVDVGGVKIVHTEFRGAEHFFFSFIQINRAS